MTFPKSPWSMVAAVVAWAMLAPPATAQITTGNISGTVQDAQGALVPGAATAANDLRRVQVQIRFQF